MVAEVNSRTFENKVLNAKMPVLVEVWAPWCGPCKAMAPVLNNISKEFSGKAKVVKLNADKNPELTRKYKVMGLPTLLYFSHGRLVDRKMGLQAEPVIVKRLTPLLEFSDEDAMSREINGLFRIPFRGWFSKMFSR